MVVVFLQYMSIFLTIQIFDFKKKEVLLDDTAIKNKKDYMLLFNSLIVIIAIYLEYLLQKTKILYEFY